MFWSYRYQPVIGPASALLKNKNILIKKNIQVIGVDYDQIYINHAEKLVKKENAENIIQVHCLSVYDKDLESVIDENGNKFMEAMIFTNSRGRFSLNTGFPIGGLRICGDQKMNTNEAFL